jgi:hypothetical protein
MRYVKSMQDVIGVISYFYFWSFYNIIGVVLDQEYSA